MAKQRPRAAVTTSQPHHPRPKHPISNNRKPSRTKWFFSWEEKFAAILKLEEQRNSANIENSGYYPGLGCGSFPFLEDPVKFQFEDDYGKELFLQLQREVLCTSIDHVLALGARENNNTRDDVYFLQTQEDMVTSFLKENLF